MAAQKSDSSSESECCDQELFGDGSYSLSLRTGSLADLVGCLVALVDFRFQAGQ